MIIKLCTFRKILLDHEVSRLCHLLMILSNHNEILFFFFFGKIFTSLLS